MKKANLLVILIGLLILSGCVQSQEETLQTSYQLPPNNPFLIQNSVYPVTHFDASQTDATTLPIWQGDFKLEPSQVDWLPGLTHIGVVHRPYAGAEHALFFAGGNRIGKIRITGGEPLVHPASDLPGPVRGLVQLDERRPEDRLVLVRMVVEQFLTVGSIDMI